MKVFYVILLALPILTYSDTRLGNFRRIPLTTKRTQDCKKVDCPAVEDPVCVKLKHKHGNNFETAYVLMINKCEFNYVKCHRNLEAAVVQMKYCDHKNHAPRNDKSTLKGKRRAKRSAKYELNSNKNNFNTKVISKSNATKLNITNKNDAKIKLTPGPVILTKNVTNMKPMFKARTQRPRDFRRHKSDGSEVEGNKEEEHSEKEEANQVISDKEATNNEGTDEAAAEFSTPEFGSPEVAKPLQAENSGKEDIKTDNGEQSVKTSQENGEVNQGISDQAPPNDVVNRNDDSNKGQGSGNMFKGNMFSGPMFKENMFGSPQIRPAFGSPYAEPPIQGSPYNGQSQQAANSGKEEIKTDNGEQSFKTSQEMSEVNQGMSEQGPPNDVVNRNKDSNKEQAFSNMFKGNMFEKNMFGGNMFGGPQPRPAFGSPYAEPPIQGSPYDGHQAEEISQNEADDESTIEDEPIKSNLKAVDDTGDQNSDKDEAMDEAETISAHDNQDTSQETADNVVEENTDRNAEIDEHENVSARGEEPVNSSQEMGEVNQGISDQGPSNSERFKNKASKTGQGLIKPMIKGSMFDNMMFDKNIFGHNAFGPLASGPHKFPKGGQNEAPYPGPKREVLIGHKEIPAHEETDVDRHPANFDGIDRETEYNERETLIGHKEKHAEEETDFDKSGEAFNEHNDADEGTEGDEGSVADQSDDENINSDEQAQDYEHVNDRHSGNDGGDGNDGSDRNDGNYESDESDRNYGSDGTDHGEFTGEHKSRSGEAAHGDEEELQEQVNLDQYDSDCPTACPSRAVMVCGRCQHGVFRTFMSVCHMRMFNCQHDDEDMELMSRLPCVMSAPFLSSSGKMVMTPQGKVRDPGDQDKILTFINCRNKGLITPNLRENLEKEADKHFKKCNFDAKQDYSSYGY